MRKHDVRKWIHAVLDMLPLFIIPIFAIYMHRHNVTDYEVTRDKYQVVEFKQLNTLIDDTYSENGVDFTIDNDGINIVSGNATSTASWWAFNYILRSDEINGHRVYIKFDSCPSNVSFNYVGQSSAIITADYLSYGFVVTSGAVDYHTQVNIFDLTAMFGSGNEPTISQFESWFGSDYYPLNYSEEVLINIGTETLDDTDIGSQFVYALYLPIEKYFNFNNVATFNNMYQWFTTNFFNGNVPLVVPIVWNIILYEFIMDILFLIYAVFMFIIDFVECLIDKAFGKSYRGGR